MPVLQDEPTEEEEDGHEEGKWLVETANLAPDTRSIHLLTLYAPDTALAGSQNADKAETESEARGASHAPLHAQEAGANESRSTASCSRQRRYSRSRAELVRGLACAEILLLSWHQASQAGSVVMIGKLLARRARSGLLPSSSSSSSSAAPAHLPDHPAWHQSAQERVFAFKILLCGVPEGDDDALRWLVLVSLSLPCLRLALALAVHAVHCASAHSAHRLFHACLRARAKLATHVRVCVVCWMRPTGAWCARVCTDCVCARRTR